MKVGCGRRQESNIWPYLEFVLTKNRSRCLVKLESGKFCGEFLSEKNFINLKVHLKSCHPKKRVFLKLNYKYLKDV